MTKKIHLTNCKSSLFIDFIYILFIELTLNTAFFLKSKDIDIRHKNKNGEDSLKILVLNDTNGSMIELASTLISKDIKKEELKTLIDISYNQLKERYGYYYLFAYEPNSINYFLRDKYSSM